MQITPDYVTVGVEVVPGYRTVLIDKCIPKVAVRRFWWMDEAFRKGVNDWLVSMFGYGPHPAFTGDEVIIDRANRVVFISSEGCRALIEHNMKGAH